MRTTLTINEDVAVVIARRRRERETGLKEEINHPFHAAAREWLEARLSGTQPVGQPWAALLGFARRLVHARCAGATPEPA